MKAGVDVLLCVRDLVVLACFGMGWLKLLEIKSLTAWAIALFNLAGKCCEKVVFLLCC